MKTPNSFLEIVVGSFLAAVLLLASELNWILYFIVAVFLFFGFKSLLNFPVNFFIILLVLYLLIVLIMGIVYTTKNPRSKRNR